MRWVVTLFVFDDEQQALRAAVRDFAESSLHESRLRQVMTGDPGFDPEVWRRMAQELGLAGLAVPAEFGGAGAGMIELAIVVEELGRVCDPGPLVSSALAALAIAAGGDENTKSELLSRLAAGTAIGTVAVAEREGRWSSDGVTCRAVQTDRGWTVMGEKHYVAHAPSADLFVVAARADSGVGLFVVEGSVTGVKARPVTGFDLTRRLGVVAFDAARAQPLGTVGDTALLDKVLLWAAVLAAAESVGGAQAVLDMAVEYAKIRVQFGRAIGSFQAIKHMCADMLLDVESARSAAYYAAWAAAGASDDLATVAPLAKAFCSDVFFESASTNMQVHGGISFTWESACHLYYRRSKSSRQLWGDPSVHRDALAARIGLNEEAS